MDVANGIKMDNTGVSLMDFSDCLLLNVLKFLDSSSLYEMTKLNSRLESLILDASLWKWIDARGGPDTCEKVKYCLKRMTKQTTVLCLKGGSANDHFLMGLQMKMSTDNLTILALEDQLILEPFVTLNKFPKTLTELSFRRSVIENSGFFFKRTSERMVNLKVLILDECYSINSSVVMSVSKYPCLEVLSFYKCKMENSIPYFSIASWHGFKMLKVLDVRLSGLGNPFLKSMIRCSSIVAFYFQNMDTSYVVDFRNRKLELDEDAVPDTGFKAVGFEQNDDFIVTDKGTSEFKRASSKNQTYSLPESFLYTDPYGPCTCGFSRGEVAGPSVKYPKNYSDDDPWRKYLCDGRRDFGRVQVKERPGSPNRRKSSKRKGKRGCKKPNCKKRRRSSSSMEANIMSSTSESDEDTQDVALNLSMPKRKARSDQGGCSISSTETVECREENDSSKRRRLGDEEDTSKREKFIEISWRNDSVQRRHGNIGTGPVTSPYPFGEEQNDPAVPGCSNRDAAMPSTSGVIDLCQSSSNDEEDDIGTEQERPSTPSREGGNPEDVQNRIGVVLRNRVDENNRNVLQICIRGNRDRRSLFVPEVIRMGQGVDFPIVLNAVRMINFMLPPEQQDEIAAQNPDLEVVNLRDKIYSLALKRLSFRGYWMVTDATLGHLEHLGLDLLDLTYTGVTRGGINAFLRMNPNCRVLHRDFCVCKPKMHF